jgi:hypothetical protein
MRPRALVNKTAMAAAGLSELVAVAAGEGPIGRSRRGRRMHFDRCSSRMLSPAGW